MRIKNQYVYIFRMLCFVVSKRPTYTTLLLYMFPCTDLFSTYKQHFQHINTHIVDKHVTDSEAMRMLTFCELVTWNLGFCLDLKK